MLSEVENVQNILLSVCVNGTEDYLKRAHIHRGIRNMKRGKSSELPLVLCLCILGIIVFHFKLHRDFVIV